MKANLFDGDSLKAQYARIAYHLLKSRDWISNQNVINEFYKDIPENRKPAKLIDAEGYGELKKAFTELIKAIVQVAGEGSIEIRGNNRNRQWKYSGIDPDPLSELEKLRTINSLSEFREFCRSSAGFIPEEWIDYFFKGTHQLLDIKTSKKKGTQFVSSDIQNLKNIELLPFLYEVIRDKKILKIKYKFVEKEEINFHPHLLKEYNGRWFLFGHAEGLEPEYGYNLPLDRIMGQPEIHKSSEFFNNPPKDFYKNFFKDIVGVTHDDKWPEVEEIAIRARNYRMFNLIHTKPFHPSQEVTKDYNKEEKYGEFKVRIKVNNEFIGRILQLGAGIEIVSPPHVRELVKQRISNMLNLYNQEQTEQ